MLTEPAWKAQGLYDGVELLHRAFEKFYYDHRDEFESGEFVEGEFEYHGHYVQMRGIQDPKHEGHFIVNYEIWRGQKLPEFCPDSMGHFMYTGHADMIKRMHIHDF